MDTKDTGADKAKKVTDAAAQQARVVGEAAAQQAKIVGAAAAQHAKIAGEAAAQHAQLVFSDLWHAVRTERTVQLMLAVLIVSLICWKMPGVSMVLYPFKLFVTTLHEACHALVARITGGNVAVMLITPEEEGVTMSMGGFRPLVIPAGYIGTSLLGALFIWWGRKPEEARFILQSLGTAILALAIFYGGGG